MWNKRGIFFKFQTLTNQPVQERQPRQRKRKVLLRKYFWNFPPGLEALVNEWSQLVNLEAFRDHRLLFPKLNLLQTGMKSDYVLKKIVVEEQSIFTCVVLSKSWEWKSVDFFPVHIKMIKRFSENTLILKRIWKYNTILEWSYYSINVLFNSWYQVNYFKKTSIY